MVLSDLVVAGAALLAAANLPAVLAQATSNATCLPQFQWMTNSKQQNPCLASAYLSAQCNGGQWNVPALSGTQPYNNPTGAAANLCRCNTVTYNLLQACSYCQGANIGGWLDWTTNCTAGNTTIGSYPLPLPGGVAVPNWAYLDFTQQDRFLPDAAQQAAGTSPESVSGAAGTQIQTSYTGGSSATSAGSTATATSTPAPQEGGSSSNTGAIAGGVVGGVLGLALFALLAWFLVRKKSDKPAAAPPMQETYPSQPYAGTTYSGPGYESGYPVQQPYGTGQYTPVAATGASAQFDPYGGAPGTPYKPYDPSDPSTFPTTPGPGNAPTVHSGPYSEYSNNPQQQPRPGQYNYAAEI